MRVTDIRGWPPRWESFDPGKIATGEIGLLKGVSRSAVKGELHLLMEHKASQYKSVLVLDETTLERAMKTLADSIDKTLAEIGRLDLSHQP